MDLLRKAGGSVAELNNIFGQATGLRDLKKSIRSAASRGARDISIAAGAYGANPIPGKALDFNTWDAQSAQYADRYRGKPATNPTGESGGLQRKQGKDGKWYVNDGTGWRAE
jgi:hypothetical protein